MVGRIWSTSNSFIIISKNAAGFDFCRATQPLPDANFVATIHHGIPLDLHRPSFARGNYLAFLGRISPEKRPDRAIKIAQRVGLAPKDSRQGGQG